MKFPGFVTGSRRYGTPRETKAGVMLSDIDLVVLVEDDESFELICEACTDDGGSDAVEEEEGRRASLKFDDLNLIIVDTPELYMAWKNATDELVAMRPVTRDQAIEVHRKHRAAAGIKGCSTSPSEG